MKLGILLIVTYLTIVGCSSSTDSLSKKALEQYLSENYRIDGSTQIDSLKVLSSELINTDLNRKHYSCVGLIKLRCVADAPYPSREGIIIPGEKFFQTVSVNLRFSEGSTGEVQIDTFRDSHINSRENSK